MTINFLNPIDPNIYIYHIYVHIYVNIVHFATVFQKVKSLKMLKRNCNEIKY